MQTLQDWAGHSTGLDRWPEEPKLSCIPLAQSQESHSTGEDFLRVSSVAALFVDFLNRPFDLNIYPQSAA